MGQLRVDDTAADEKQHAKVKTAEPTKQSLGAELKLTGLLILFVISVVVILVLLVMGAINVIAVLDTAPAWASVMFVIWLVLRKK